MKISTKSILLLGASIVALNASAEATWQWHNNSSKEFIGLQRASAIMADFNADDKLDVMVHGNGWNAYYDKPGAWSWEQTASIYYNEGNKTWSRDIIEVVPRVDEETGEPVLNDNDEQLYSLVPAKHGMAPLRFPNYCIFDFNNDGLVDVLIQGETSTDDLLGYRDIVPHEDDGDGMWCMLLYKNLGNGSFELVQDCGIPVIKPDYNGGHAVWTNQFGFGDYDHDGYTDIVMSGLYINHDEDTPGRCALLLRNLNGTGKFEDMKIAKTIGGAWTNNTDIRDGEGNVIETIPGKELKDWFMPISGSAHFADVNNDGWLDIVFNGWTDNCQDTRHSQGGSTTRIYINKNGEYFNDETAGSEFYVLRASSLGWGDFDQDGYLDFVNVGWGDDGSAWSSRIFYNAGEGAEEVFPYGDNTTGNGLSGDENCNTVVRDFDGDGNLDVLYDGKNDNRIFYGDGTGSFEAAPQLPVRGHGPDDGNGGYGDVTGNGLADRFQVGYNWVADNYDGINYRDEDHYNIGGDWTMDASLWYNETEADVEAPAAPANIAAAIDDNNNLTVTWEDLDDMTVAYNVVITNTANNEVISILPANVENGFLRVTLGRHTAVRPGVQSYTVKVAEISGSYTANVQAVSLYNETYSQFAASAPVLVGVDTIKVDDTKAPVEYYNLQGVRVNEPANGIFIRRQGTTAVKVVK